MKAIYLLFLPLILCLHSSFFSSAQTILFDGQTESFMIGNRVEVLTDSSNSKTANDLLNSPKFQKSTLLVPNFGVSNYKHWIRFCIKNESARNSLLIHAAQPQVDVINCYLFNEKGELLEKSILGDNLPFKDRQYKHPNPVFELKIPKGETRTVLLQVESGQQLVLPLSVGTIHGIVGDLGTKDVLFGIYFGVILAMFFYNIFIYFSLKDKSYLLYVIYVLSVGVLQSCLEGYTYKFLWPESPWLANQSVTILSGFSASLAMIFFRMFLQAAKFTPLLNKGLYFFIGIYVLAISLSLMGYYNQAYNIIQLNAMIVAIYLYILSIVILRKGYKAAKFFLIAWSTFLVGVCVYVLKDFEILPYNLITNYTMQTGSALEVIFLSFALADRINILKKEKEESQQQAINALKENELLITNQNVLLEQKVAQRTHELETAYKELQNTQTQLVSSEKMASLGQLTAGIAHEINNPINFVVSSIAPLKRDISDIKELLDKYDEITPKTDMGPKLAEIEKLKKEIDIDFVKEEIEMLLKGITDGAVRTAEIVKSLKTFSRVDESDLKRADLNEGLASTIVLLTQQWSGKIDLIKNFGTIPHIECYPGKLNQVFMNILNNAIQAILANPKPNVKGKIEVSTQEEAGNIVISIKDNGMGMSAETKKKIFDPFFTTKEVGKGTGLGLSITYSIIEKHGGVIEVVSELGEGAEFLIRLPIVDEFVIKPSAPADASIKN